MCFHCQESKGHAFLWREWGKLSRSTSLIFMLIHTSRTYLFEATKYSSIHRFGFACPSSLMSKSQTFWSWTWGSFMVFRYYYYYYWSLLYSAILHSRADSLCLHVILHEWLAFYSAFLNIHRSGVLTVLAWLVPHETAAISARSVYTIQPCTVSLHAKPHM